MPMSELISTSLMLFTWRDAVEILFFSSIIYYVSIWLKKDTQKNLLGYFYLYCLTFLITYTLDLTAITYALTIGIPGIAAIFVLIHQRTLQKNLIALANITPTQQPTTSWLETFVQTCLATIDSGKEVTCVIEYKESLETLVTSPITLHTALNKDILELLLTSPCFDNSKMLWLNAQGMILGINATWLMPRAAHELSLEQNNYHTWKTAAIFFTSATDAIIVRALPTNRTFTLVIHGTAYEQLRAPDALAHIRTYLHKDHSSIKGEFHVKPSHQQHERQSNS